MARFYEVLGIPFDFEALLAEVKSTVFTAGPQVIQGEEYETDQYQGFGGWSLTSHTGSWRDGFEFFQNGEGKALEVFFPKDDNNYAALKYFGIAHSLEHNKPTELCRGEIKRVLDKIEALGLTPRRARVTCLKARCKSLVHTDGSPNEYIARIHIPLITNKKCRFICDGQNLHMEAGKIYMVWVNTWHQIRNDSDEDRYHIIMDAYDLKGITQNFAYHGNINELERYAQDLRAKIDATEISPELRERFDTARDSIIAELKNGRKK